MNLYYQFLFWGLTLSLAGLTATVGWALALVIHDRYVNGNVDAFKPERRVGPPDRRAGLSGQ